MAFFQEIQCFFLSLERSSFAQSLCSSHLKTLTGRQYSFQKETQFSKGNNVLHLLASNINSFLARYTVILPFTCIGLLCTKVMFLTLENPEG
jgi:hypothetical protein